MKRDEVSLEGQQVTSDQPKTGDESAQSALRSSRPAGGDMSDLDPDAPLGDQDEPASPDVASKPQVALRTDLRLVREGGTSESDAKRLPGRLRIIDLRTDRQFDFTSQEHFLCVAADGKATHQDLQSRLTELTTTPLSVEQVSKFFRRLQIIGLVDSADAGPTTSRSGQTRFSNLRAAPGSDAKTTNASDPATESKSTAPLPRYKPRTVTPKFTKDAKDIPATDLPATEVAETDAAPVRPAASQRSKPSTAKLLTLRSETAKEPPKEASKADPDPFDDPEAEPNLFGPDISFDSGDDRDDDWEFEPANDRPRFRRPGGAGMGGGIGGGGMGGMMGGGMMGGGMGGGMGPGMGGGMMGGMMGGGMGAGMMGGGMMGMRGAAQPAAPAPKGPTQFGLVNPHSFLRVLYVLGWPLKFVFLGIIPLGVFAGMTLIHRFPQLISDVSSVLESVNFLLTLLLGLGIVNLSSKIAQGVAIVAHGGRVNDLGINLMMGITPRFYVDISAVDGLDRRGQLWAFGAPLLARFFAFCVGILGWAMTREAGGTFPILMLIIGKFGLFDFLITSLPMIPGDGMKFMGAFFNEPKLLIKSIIAFKHKVFGSRLPPMMDPSEVWPLTLFAIGAMLTTTTILVGTAAMIFVILEGSLGGLGVSLFLCLVTISLLWFYAMTLTNKKRQGQFGPKMAMAGAQPGRAPAAPERGPAPFTKPGPGGNPGQARPGPMRGRAEPAAANAPVLGAEDAADPLPNRARVVWTILLIGALIVAFLPYGYETGGQVTILPAERGYSVARSDGEIAHVYVEQGQFVTAGTVLAELSNWDQTSNIAISEAKLAGATASLAKLEVGAQPEQIAVERAQVARAEATLLYKKFEVERNRELLASSTVSKATLDKAEADYAAAVADLEVAKANLALVEIGSTPEELEIARAEVLRQKQELAFARDELERTKIVAPIDGRIITADLHLRTGGYLRTGDQFIELERIETVTATISVPEADIGLIKPGQTVRLRARSESGIEVLGVVKQIAPVAEDSGYGLIVRATAEFPNTSGLLRSEMTGYAKIDGVEMRVWEAYFRSIVRFFQIDVWSWIP